MGRFSASLKTIGDRRGMPATVDLDSGRISITLGESQIGDWALEEVRLEPIANGYRMTAEGEQIFLEMDDTTEFASELSTKPKRLGRRRDRSKGEKAKSDKDRPARKSRRRDAKPASPVALTAPYREESSRVQDENVSGPSEAEEVDSTGESLRHKTMRALDRVIVLTERKWGALLPDWVFTRSALITLTALLILLFVFPGWSSLLLLGAGLLAVALGAVLFSDNILAAKWLPGRMTPRHVLVSGVSILVFGVLLGVIAN